MNARDRVALFLDGLRKSRFVSAWWRSWGWPYFAMAAGLVLASAAWAQYYPGILTLFFRDQGYQTANDTARSFIFTGVAWNHLVPYLQYPLEYPFLAGGLMLLVNLAGYAFRPDALAALQSALFFSSVMMGAACAAVVTLWARCRVPAYKALLLFALSPLVLDQFDINFDMWAAALLLASVYLLARGRRGWSAASLALSAGIKGFPLIALPLMAWYAAHPGGRGASARYAATCLGVFGAGMAFQYALSPTNFLRAGSYLSGYGIEGSWLGLLFPSSIIDYLSFSTWSSWIALGSTALHGLQPYQLASLALLGACLALVWRARRRLAPKVAAFYLVSAVVLFWWWSPPQFLYYPLALLPLVAPRFLPALALVAGWQFFGTDPLWIRVPPSVVAFTSPDWLYLSVGYQACLAAYLVWTWRHGGFSPARAPPSQESRSLGGPPAGGGTQSGPRSARGGRE